ncbi:hypothetical protein A2763_03065 [Candidatus Kaiserbacteria bacterium RIFCSPHIGHO2_01_FULL_54_36]|uniref:Co-chaperonin GroES n=1 Tax=Candidatus Kaiserbacteria bacterium RIFCSPHIGHO2_01_FULL_54_36 TaxID=1798482 RepID=A0A1F6CK65_9BACT|nr:MAG: hypothetical protein A2763_03065 [Candidatus Kaiserbacteria bacterium RIFCSPHIGHO2_01_FULL_54_36]OGG75380.1 MAG: hypothetical protein A3A41_02320 [Candidatus Kaiserbacteria bacterium RIFCSPLOWO2_01_FULL_54_22]
MKKETKKDTKEPNIKMRLLGDRVLVKPEEAMKKTAGGIYIPDAAKQEKPTRGIVLAVGPGRMNDDGKVLPMQVKPGQKVYFNPGWESEIEIDEQKLHLIHESDVKAIIT